MNILDGLYQPDAGEILIDGRPVAFRSPRDAIAAGLGMVHQHFTLVASMTVTENVLIGLDRPRFRLDLGRYDAEIGRLAEEHGLRVDPRAKVWQLSVGERQRVEILKVLYRGARVLIMDEPTAVLAPQEIDDLFRTLRSMTEAGRSIVFISHKLGEVLAIADRITVMRRGRVTAARAAGRRRDEDPARHADGRPRGPREPRAHVAAARARSCSPLEDVEADGDKGVPALRGVSLEVRAGEIVGIAAVAGNGQSELAEVITGLRPCRGRVLVGGEDIANRPVRKAIQRGVAHVPEDRTGVGTAPNLSLVDNLIMKRYRASPIGRGWTIDMGAARAAASQLKDSYEIAAPSIETQARLLSGRQHPAPDPRPRDRVRAAPDDRRPADARAGRRARSSRPTGCSSSGGPRGPRSSSSPRTSTRSSRSRTGSPCCTRAGSSGSWTPPRPTSPRSAC